MSLPPSYNLFKLYPNEVFVETGTYRGDAIVKALEVPYKKIISIDIDPQYKEHCTSLFDLNNPESQLKDKIELHTGDSANALWNIIRNIKKPITFWLDSHWQMFEDTDPGLNPFPLLQEIEQIGRHKIKNHTILIDDCLIMQWNIVGYDLNLIKTMIEKINPAYEFKMHANPVINGIMAATVKP